MNKKAPSFREGVGVRLLPHSYLLPNLEDFRLLDFIQLA